MRTHEVRPPPCLPDAVALAVTQAAELRCGSNVESQTAVQVQHVVSTIGAVSDVAVEPPYIEEDTVAAVKGRGHGHGQQHGHGHAHAHMYATPNDATGSVIDAATPVDSYATLKGKKRTVCETTAAASDSLAAPPNVKQPRHGVRMGRAPFAEGVASATIVPSAISSAPVLLRTRTCPGVRGHTGFLVFATKSAHGV